MVGGTGMYIKAFCEGLDEIPPVDTAIRNEIIKAYKEKGLAWLQDEIKKKDPFFWQQAEQQNPQRLMRALEVINSTGISVTHFRTRQKKERPFRIIKLGIFLPKQQLHHNIERRVDEMIADGLVDEARSLYAYKELNALQTVGYKEIFDYIDGKNTLDEAILKIKQNTRQYAKRQVTWFKRDRSIFDVTGRIFKKDLFAEDKP
jgi:tRNA dimethylallyltransferase